MSREAGEERWALEWEALAQMCDEVVANYTAAAATACNIANATDDAAHRCSSACQLAAERLLTNR
eukprot:1271243-Pyramimonas_sp.AAC.1